MFDTLTNRLGHRFSTACAPQRLSEGDVNEALREVRVALLEADVSLAVVKDFIGKVRVKAVGQDVLRSVTPGQQVVKIVHDELTAVLGDTASGIDLNAPPGRHHDGRPAGARANHLDRQDRPAPRQKDRKKVLMASLDVQRPAAQEQLKVLASRRKSPRCRSSPGRCPPTSPSAPSPPAACRATTW